jgi:hypothetical protein
LIAKPQKKVVTMSNTSDPKATDATGDGNGTPVSAPKGTDVNAATQPDAAVKPDAGAKPNAAAQPNKAASNVTQKNKAPTPKTTNAKKASKGQAYIITGPKKGRRRAGRYFDGTAQHIPADKLSKADIAALKADPMITVELEDS